MINNYIYVNHLSLKPFIFKESKILILGSFPSVISRKENFYYANKYNRFYEVLKTLFKENNLDLSLTKDKKEFLKRHQIALYDVIEECYIQASKDSSIINPKISDIKNLIKDTDIKQVFVCGKKAYDLFIKNIQNINCIYLPSTSSANASYSLDKLVEKFKIILNYLS